MSSKKRVRIFTTEYTELHGVGKNDKNAKFFYKIPYIDFACFATFAPLREVFVLIFILFIFSCSSQKMVTHNIPIERDGQVITVVKAEIARTTEERQQGLMFRKSLADGSGMLFVLDKDEIASFWMKNTYIPLSIAFITFDGRIIDIKNMYPHDLNSVTSSRSVRYALEVPQGWFLKAGVQEGDMVKIDVIH